MMKVGIVAFSDRGGVLARILLDGLKEYGCETTGFLSERHRAEGLVSFSDLGTLIGELFPEKDIIIFVGACGIAVRAVAPYVKSKLQDPGVIVVDECGDYVISLLSGHIGRANEYAGIAARILGAEPVITTATDRNGLFAVDAWAVRNQLRVASPEMIREISSRVLSYKKVGFFSEFLVEGMLPAELTSGAADAGIVVSYRAETKRFPLTCHLIPMDLVVGIGCKKGKKCSELQDFLNWVFETYGLQTERIGKLTSVSAKEKEEGLCRLAKKLRVPFVTFSPLQLEGAEGSFSASEFVRSQMGVDNVCERSACLGSDGGRRLVAKQVSDGMTIAVYERRIALRF